MSILPQERESVDQIVSHPNMQFATLARVFGLSVFLWSVYCNCMAVTPSQKGYEDWDGMIRNALGSKTPVNVFKSAF